jgi:hypothetical protein
VVDVETHHRTFGIQIDQDAIGDFTRLGAGARPQLDVETVGIGIVVQLYRRSPRKRRSKKALCTVLPSASVTTRRMRIRLSPP